MKDSNFLIVLHDEFFVPFDFIRESVCLNVAVDKQSVESPEANWWEKL